MSPAPYGLDPLNRKKATAMRRSLSALGLLSLFLLAACRESPMPLSPGGPVADAAYIPRCQLGPIMDFSAQYFDHADFARAQALARGQWRAVIHEDIGLATSRGFDLLALIADARDAGRQAGSPQAGSSLANAVLTCMDVGPVSLPVDFSSSLSVGGFEVRGGVADPTAAVLSADNFSGVGLKTGTWLGVLGTRTLFFGLPDLNTTYAELLVGQPFTWSTIPAHPALPPGLVVGFCVLNPGTFRVAEAHASSQTILDLEDAGFFLGNCSAPSPSGLTPSQLRLALGATAGPVGGSATGFSGFAPVDPGSINLSFVQQPSSGAAGSAIAPPIQVLATGDGATPFTGVTITLGRVNRDNRFIALSPPVTTGSDGLATFASVVLSQPGTYTLVAAGSAPGYASVQITSGAFSIQ